MFRCIEISFIKENIALSIEGEEYEVLPNMTPVCLINHQLLNQLKISTIEYVYSIYKNKCIYLKKIYSVLEGLDETIRFDLDKKFVVNNSDIILINIFLDRLSLSKNLIDIYISWSKKIEWFFDFSDTNKKSSIRTQNILNQTLFSPTEMEIFENRFSILLSPSFLDKLKTYFAFWKYSHHVSFDLPIWYARLYK